MSFKPSLDDAAKVTRKQRSKTGNYSSNLTSKNQMDRFVFMKECLKEFSYPKIHSLDDLEITDIFSKVNRQFLVAWIFKHSDEKFADFVEKAGVEELANLVYGNGFCHLLEKDAFMTGECESSKQMTILYKMFHSLKIVSQNPQNTKFSFRGDIQACVNFDTNLFPMYGPKQTLTQKQRTEKIQEFRNEIDNIKDLTGENQPKTVVDRDLKTQLVAAMTSLEQIFPDFRRKVFDLMKNKDLADSKEISFSEDFPQTLQMSDEKITDVLKFIQSMNVVTSFKENNSVKSVDYDNKNNGMIRELAELCHEIAALKKEN